MIALIYTAVILLIALFLGMCRTGRGIGEWDD